MKLTFDVFHFEKKLNQLKGYKLKKVEIYSFLWNVVRQSHTDLTSFCMQFEKIGCGLLRKAFWSEGECFVS